MHNTNSTMTAVPDGLDLTLRGKCEGGSGPNLSRHPNLAYTPDRGVITHLAGVSVDQISCDANVSGIIDSLRGLALRQGCTVSEVLAALGYTADDGLM